MTFIALRKNAERSGQNAKRTDSSAENQTMQHVSMTKNGLSLWSSPYGLV